VAAGQNVLMKKLDISVEGQLEAVDFKKYVNLFKEGLTENDEQLILELIKASEVMPVELPEAA
jgi:hypothetical protein